MYYIAAAGGAAYHNYSHILKAIQDKNFDVQFENKSNQFGLLSLQGPKSRMILEKLTEDKLDNDSFPFGSNKYINVAGHKVGVQFDLPDDDLNGMKFLVRFWLWEWLLLVKWVGNFIFPTNPVFRSIGHWWRLARSTGWSTLAIEPSIHSAWKKAIHIGTKRSRMIQRKALKDLLNLLFVYRTADTPLEAGLMFTCKLKTDVDFQGRKALENHKADGGPTKKKVCFTLDDDK